MTSNTRILCATSSFVSGVIIGIGVTMDGFTAFLLAVSSFTCGIITGIGIVLDEFTK